jgi:hypothetical protein
MCQPIREGLREEKEKHKHHPIDMQGNAFGSCICLSIVKAGFYNFK